jgi:hypothetical protein
VGPVVYMSGVSACIWNSTSIPFFSYNFQDIHKVWRFMNMGDNFILRGALGINEPDYYIQTTVQYLVMSSQDNSIVRKISMNNATIHVLQIPSLT